MTPATYYLNTVSAAFEKLGPIFLLVAIGYFLFFKLPFLFLYKVNKANKPKSDEEDFTPVDYGDLNKKQKFVLKEEPINKEREEEKQLEREQERLRQQKKKEDREKERQEAEARRQYKEYEQKKKEQPPLSVAEELFDLKPGFTQKELKKRYHDLLKQNHPDKVAQLGNDFKKLAEQKTKDINKAYEELKKKAA